MTIGQRFDFTDLLARTSTWLALVSAASTAALGAYALMPARVQDLFPEWALIVLGGMAVGAAFLIPVATSFRQRGIGRSNQVAITSTVTVRGDVSSGDATRIAEAIQRTDSSQPPVAAALPPDLVASPPSDPAAP